MFQDIEPYSLTYDTARRGPEAQDRIFCLKGGLVLLDTGEGRCPVPAYEEARHVLPDGEEGLIYLFSMDGAGYYCSLSEAGGFSTYAYKKPSACRDIKPQSQAFALATAYHLAHWHALNRLCGQCAGPMQPSPADRSLLCPACGVVKYPRISPVVIVGVRDGERLLLVKNASGEYRNWGLIAGFVEAGETLEAAAAREVMEEAGLPIRNPRYYKSQPWAFSQSLLMGFFADLDGDGAITLESGELSEASWFSRRDLPPDEARFSLTWDMIQAFRTGEV